MGYMVGIIAWYYYDQYMQSTCVVLVGPSYTMSAKHKSNIGSASFICYHVIMCY